MSENSIVAFLFQSFEPLGILRSSHPSPIFFPQLNHDEYSKGSFKGSLVLILQNNEEGETMCSLVPWLCPGIKTSCPFHRCIEEVCSTYITIDDINKWIIQNEGIMNTTWNAVLTEDSQEVHEIGNSHFIGKKEAVAIAEDSFAGQLYDNFPFFSPYYLLY